MHKKPKKEGAALALALKELKNLRRMNRLEKSLFVLAVGSLMFLVFALVSQLAFTGYTAYIEAQGGTITEIDIKGTIPTSYWFGAHGLALRVPGYFGQIYVDANPGEISSSVGAFFNCIEAGHVGGNEVYISENSNINWGSLVPANISLVDTYIGCSGSEQCPSNTFTEEMWVMIGNNNLSGIPATHTYKYSHDNSVFDLGVLWDGTDFVYVTHIEDVQTGFSQSITVNFQALLPTDPDSSPRFYVFTDPNDECPEGGGLGDTILAEVTGYVKYSNGSVIENATVVFTGVNDSTDVNGSYYVSSTVSEGTYSVIVSADGYDDYIFQVDVDFTNSSFERNVTLVPETLGEGESLNPTVSGHVRGSSGLLLDGVVVLLGDDNYTTSADGYYEVSPSLAPGLAPIIAYRQGYNNYYEILEILSNSDIEHNITMEQVVYANPYPTGPYTQDGDSFDDGSYDDPPGTIQENDGEDFWVSAKEIKKEVRQETFQIEDISIFNFRSSNMNLVFTVSDELAGVVELDNNAVQIGPNSDGSVEASFYGNKPLGTYNGTITISGDLEQVIPTEVKIVEKRRTMETLLVDVGLISDLVSPGEELRYRISLQNLLRGQSYDVLLKKYLIHYNGTRVQDLGEELVEIRNSQSFLNTFRIPEEFEDGEYQIRVDAQYLNFLTSTVAPFQVRTPIYLYSFFGIPLWVFFAIIFFFSFIFLVWFLYKKEKEKKQRYSASLDYGQLPKKTDRALVLGKIAESKVPAYYPLDNMTTHAIVAGATGGGKSISAQVMVEEALLKNTAVLVFDPTAQWSGMLRKCDDKKMMSFYPKFGLKPTDAKAFPGSIRMVEDARELIDVNKHAHPGQIQIFAMNKLEPKDIDVFVANVIRGIFKSDPKEKRQLEVLLVFDEVHRLLAKFGGTGEGFLQIERACREFRKWGIGVMLVSQVLSDFVGEIKANINTEVQMRTIEEGDLSRIKTKYGDGFLKSLVKSEVGVGMIQNAEFNKGKPYFLQFRPILHNTRRLTDEELEKYNDYNNQVDQIEFEIETLENKKVDVFDLKMELKLVKDKIMTGNFSVVDIYLQGLTPRLKKQWEKIGEEAPKLEKKLADLDEIKKAVEEAKKEREKAEAAIASAGQGANSGEGDSKEGDDEKEGEEKSGEETS